jgi:anaerobic selenocysteine-containing dehydrogenase
MSAPTMSAELKPRTLDTLGNTFTVTHDHWMTDADRFLLPVTSADATFWERWGAMRYLNEHLRGQFQLEWQLLEQLRAFLPGEMRERLWMQAERLERLFEELGRLGRQRESAREVAHTARKVLEALRLWYAEIELAAGGIRWTDVNKEGLRLLTQLSCTRCGWADAQI